MKIRNGFVSNSSSSSFVVVFPQIPVSDIDVMQMMFGNPPKIRGVQGWGDESSSIYDVAGRVFDDIGKQKCNDKKKIAEALAGYEQKWGGGTDKQLFEGMIIPDYSEYDDQLKKRGLDYEREEDKIDIQKLWDKFHKRREKFVRQMADIFVEKHKNEFVYVFEYGDHNGNIEACCEQGDIFRFLPYIKINNH